MASAAGSGHVVVDGTVGARHPAAAVSEEHEYILGTDRQELERLRFQHEAWTKAAYALWERAGFRAGDAVLDLGCGPGFTSLGLAHVVGPTGRVIACDISARFLAFLRSERDRLALTQIETSLGSVEDLDLPPDHLHGVYARWLFCWLPDPGAALERVTRSVKRGGVVAIQDYLDWSAMKFLPECAAFTPVMAGCMRSWREGGGTIAVGVLVPDLAERCGLEVEHFRPLARIGCVGSLEWRWLGGFFRSYLPKVVERGLLTADELEAFQAEWDRRSEAGGSWVYTPTMVDVVLRKR